MEILILTIICLRLGGCLHALSCAAEQVWRPACCCSVSILSKQLCLWGQWSDGMFVREAGNSLMFVAFVLKVLFMVFVSLYSIVLR